MNPALEEKIHDALAYETARTLAIGWLRHEVVRRLSPPEFEKLWRESQDTKQRFDVLVDRLASQDVTRGGGK